MNDRSPSMQFRSVPLTVLATQAIKSPIFSIQKLPTWNAGYAALPPNALGLYLHPSMNSVQCFCIDQSACPHASSLRAVRYPAIATNSPAAIRHQFNVPTLPALPGVDIRLTPSRSRPAAAQPPPLQSLPINAFQPATTPQFHFYQPTLSAAAVMQTATRAPAPARSRRSENAEEIEDASPTKRRRTTVTRGGKSKRRVRVPAPIDTHPPSTVCGVGPSLQTCENLPPSSPPRASVPLPQQPSASLQLPHQKPREKSTSATDVWYFCRAHESDQQPDNWPPAAADDPVLRRKPRSLWLSCKLCLCVCICQVTILSLIEFVYQGLEDLQEC